MLLVLLRGYLTDMHLTSSRIRRKFLQVALLPRRGLIETLPEARAAAGMGASSDPGSELRQRGKP